MNYTKEMKEYLESQYPDSEIKFYCDYDDPPKNPTFPIVNVSQIDSQTSYSRMGKDVETNITMQLHIICDRMVIDGVIVTPRQACIEIGDDVLDKFRTQFGFEVINSPSPYPYNPQTPDTWVKTYRMTAKYYNGHFYKT